MTKVKVLGWFFLGVFLTSMIMSFFNPSCFLCDIERYIVLFVAISCLFDKSIWARIGLIGMLLVGGYHVLLQFRFVPTPSVCVVNPANLHRARCDDRSAKILQIPMPMYVVMLSIFGLGALWQRK